MEAKLIKVIPQREGLAYYFRTYEYECVECGKHYTRHQCNKRISPYCCKCNAKRENQKQKERLAKRNQKMIESVLDKIKAEIDDLHLIGYATVDGKREIASRVILQIIDKYKEGNNE